MRKKLIQCVFQINQESLQHFEILLKEILPQSLHEGTLKQFHYQYDPNNTNYTLFQTSITQFKKLLYSNIFDEEDAWFFYCQNKTTYLECIKINFKLYVSIIIKESLYVRHILLTENIATTINTLILNIVTLSDHEAAHFTQEHFNLLVISNITKSQLSNYIAKIFSID